MKKLNTSLVSLIVIASFLIVSIESYCQQSKVSIYNSIETDTLVFTGFYLGDHFGANVSSAGDMNGDGCSDMIVGAPGFDGGKGKAFIFFGGNPIDNIPDLTLTGKFIGQPEMLGRTVASAGDLNGDGFSDVLISAHNVGKVYVLFGALLTDSIPDLVIENLSYFGRSMSSAGDFNNDGYSDIIVGTPYKSRAHIYLGGIEMDTVEDLKFSDWGNLGNAVSSAGDVNNDGFDDVIISNEAKNKAIIYFGNNIQDTIADVILTGETNVNSYGTSVSSAGDLNKDGFSDVMVSTYSYNVSRGRVYIYFGGVNMDTTADKIITGKDEYDYFGVGMSPAGDVNNDGYSDILISSFGNNSLTGRSYIFYGGASMDTIPDKVFNGKNQGDYFGSSVAYAGDVNCDNYSDFMIGSEGYNGNTGRVYLYYLLQPQIRLNLKLLFEGLYYPLFNQMSRRDTVKVYLKNSIFPYSNVDSCSLILDSLNSFNIFSFYNAPSGNYYVVVKHFQSIETWSKLGGEVLYNNGELYNYDFTTSSSQAYGNNLKLKGSKYCIYTGDLNQSGFIDATELSLVENDAAQFVSGRFVLTDLNGDEIVDASDYLIVDNNAYNFVGVVRP